MNRLDEGVQTYRYTGPETYHALIGQLLSAAGYVGGHEVQDIGAIVALQEERDGQMYVSCVFTAQGRTQRFAARISRREELKRCILSWHQQFCGASDNPWGTLTGVRPTKLVHRLFDQGMDDEAAQHTLQTVYGVRPSVARDLTRIARRQQPYVHGSCRTAAVYIGLPYCPSHCLYCSFPSRLIGSEDSVFLRQFAAAVQEDIADIAALCRQYGLTVDTLYVGGGTPTCLPEPMLQAILERAGAAFPAIREWTVEAGRPDTATESMLSMLKHCGVTRISVNPQTMQQHLLDILGRRHTIEDIYAMYKLCRQMAFPVVNMDFIAGLPGQTAEDMRENMEIVCQLHPENVTIHTLALKKRAPLFHHSLRGAIPGAQDVAQMLALCRSVMTDAGYVPYYLYRQKYMAASFANVGYALPGAISPYNIEMMEERQTVLAAGPGGATKYICPDGHSLKKLYMPKDVSRYVQALSENMRQRRHLCAMIYGGEDW